MQQAQLHENAHGSARNNTPRGNFPKKHLEELCHEAFAATIRSAVPVAGLALHLSAMYISFSVGSKQRPFGRTKSSAMDDSSPVFALIIRTLLVHQDRRAPARVL